MKQQNQTPRYAHLQYSVLYELDISITEYFMLDMLYHLSGGGHYWCNKKLDNIAYDMKLTKRGVIKIRDRLIERKLLIKGTGNRLRTSEKVNKVYLFDNTSIKKSELSSKKLNFVHPKSELSSSKTSVENNKRLTLDYRDSNNLENADNRGTYSPAKERVREMLKHKGILKKI